MVISYLLLSIFFMPVSPVFFYSTENGGCHHDHNESDAHNPEELKYGFHLLVGSCKEVPHGLVSANPLNLILKNERTTTIGTHIRQPPFEKKKNHCPPNLNVVEASWTVKSHYVSTFINHLASFPPTVQGQR